MCQALFWVSGTSGKNNRTPAFVKFIIQEVATLDGVIRRGLPEEVN